MKAVMYHYVRPDDPRLPHFRHLRVDEFQAQLDFFEKTGRFYSRAEMLEAFRAGRILEDAVILTFDDGLKDHYRYVYPALKARGICGIFYVPGGPVQTGRMLDVHRVHLLLGRFGGKRILESLLNKTAPEMLSHDNVREFRERTYLRQKNDDETKQVKRILNYFMDDRYRSAVIDSLMAEFMPDAGDLSRDFYLSEDELSEMHQAGMLLGAHTVNHPCLSKLSSDEQRREIDDSFAFVENITRGEVPRTFCYPYGGAHSFSSETERLLERAGSLFAFSVEPRDITREDLAQARQKLPRYDCNQFFSGVARAAVEEPGARLPLANGSACRKSYAPRS